MKWHKKAYKYEAEYSTVRIRKGFLFFPKYIKDEARWLEYACWKEMYRHFTGWVVPQYGLWESCAWIDDPQEEV